MQYTIEQYYQILGLANGSSLDDIKKAYRNKAKQFHPDRNNEPYAHDKFVLITEAYEYLISHQKPGFSFKPNTKEEQKKHSRDQAARMAKMRYEEFLKSEYYKSTTAISAFIDIIIFCSVCVFLLWIIYYTFTSAHYLVCTLVIALLFGFLFLVKSYNLRNDQNINHYIDAIKYLLRKRYAIYSLIGAFNLVIFFYVGFSTLIAMNLLLLAYISVGALSFSIAQMFFKSVKWEMLLSGISVFSIMLLVNYIFSSSKFEITYKLANPEFQSSSLIYLEDDALNEFSGVRFFWSLETIRGKRNVKYTFADGLLGWKVVKERTLN